MTSVHKCPVCEGRGTVPATFYLSTPYATVGNISPVTCKSCNGTGVITVIDSSLEVAELKVAMRNYDNISDSIKSIGIHTSATGDVAIDTRTGINNRLK